MKFRTLKIKKFKKELKRIKDENDKIDEAKKIDPIKMLRRYGGVADCE